MDGIRVHFFGIPRITLDGSDVPFHGRPKVLPLLAMLLLERGALRRDVAAARLWPDEPEDRCRAAFRRHLQYLDAALAELGFTPSPVLRDGASIAFASDRVPWTDVSAFEAASASDDTLSDAAALYRGDLLEPYADEWIVEARERYRAQHVSNLERLIARHRDRKEIGLALRWAEELRRLEPYREDIVRLVMRLRCAAGDRTSALHEYEKYSAFVASELGVSPLPETELLGRALRERDGEPKPQGAPLELTSFVGRDEELGTLQVAARNHRLITVTGPPGVGKSRLAARAAGAIAA